MQNLFKHPVWQRIVAYTKRIYIVVRHAATVISIAFACLNAWQFVTWLLNQTA